jgi:hypothetical protein
MDLKRRDIIGGRKTLRLNTRINDRAIRKNNRQINRQARQSATQNRRAARVSGQQARKNLRAVRGDGAKTAKYVFDRLTSDDFLDQISNMAGSAFSGLSDAAMKAAPLLLAA